MNDLVNISPKVLAQLTSPDGNIQPFVREIFLSDALLEGTLYDETRAIFDKLTTGKEVEICNEENKENSSVIVQLNGIVLGWLPNNQACIISQLISAGKEIICRISNARQYNEFMTDCHKARISIKIYMID